MIIAWMLYAICVGLLLTVAAILLERPLRDRAIATRRIWVAVLVGALAWPAMIVIMSRSTATPVPAPTYAAAAATVLDHPTPATAAPVRRAPAVVLPAIVPLSANLDRSAARVAVVTPILVLAILLLELVRLARARRRWHAGLIDGVPVLVSADFGPAIVGIWRPRIVIPAWTLELPAEQRALMMAHETEHLASRDSRWLGLAFLAVTMAPWNVGLWWLLRRFRLAMEVDCDRRVLRRGYDIAAYGDLLLEIGRRGTGRSLLAAGFAERRSMLRERIESMTTTVGGRSAWRIVAGSLVLLGACVLNPSHGSAPTPTLATARTLLPPRVGDSIIVDRTTFKAARAARGLPSAAFRVTESAASGSTSGCATRMIDDRDSTRLQLESSTTRSNEPTGTGYYAVRPAGRYGVATGEMLRVGCPGNGVSLLAENRLDLNLNEKLSLAGAIEKEFGVKLDSLRRSDGQLKIGFVGAVADTTRERARDVARFAWKRLGRDTIGLDTVKVQVTRFDRTPRFIQSSEWFFYRTRPGDLMTPER